MQIISFYSVEYCIIKLMSEWLQEEFSKLFSRKIYKGIRSKKLLFEN